MRFDRSGPLLASPKPARPLELTEDGLKAQKKECEHLGHQLKELGPDEFCGSALELTVDLNGTISPEQRQTARLVLAQRLDRRCTAEQMGWVDGGINAARLLFHSGHIKRLGLNVIAGMSGRTIDKIIDGALLEQLVESGGEAVWSLVNEGPEIDQDGQKPVVWERTPSMQHLLAGLVRQFVLEGGESHRTSATLGTRQELQTALKGLGNNFRKRPGGASLVAVLTAATMGAEIATLFTLGPTPGDVLAAIPDGIRLLNGHGNYFNPKCAPADESEVGHFTLSFGRVAEEPFSRQRANVNGLMTPLKRSGSGKLIITGSKSPAGFATVKEDSANALAEEVTDLALQRAARDHHLFFLTGTGYTTRLSPEGCQRESQALATGLTKMRAQGLTIALEYSEPKNVANEPTLFKELRGKVDLFAINAPGEAQHLIHSLHRAGQLSNSALARVAHLHEEVERRHPWKTDAPAWLFESTLVLQDAMKVPFVRGRGVHADVLIAGVPVSDPEALVTALHLSRYAGALKVANSAHGLLMGKEDLFALDNSATPEALAAQHGLADAVENWVNQTTDGRCRFTQHDRHQLIRRGYVKLPDGRTLFAIAPFPMYNFDGELVSAGDTIGITFAMAAQRIVAQSITDAAARKAQSSPAKPRLFTHYSKIPFPARDRVAVYG